MDFYKIKEKSSKRGGEIEVYPDFKVCRSKDLMIRGKDFYAVWDEARGLWSTDEYDVQRLVDEELYSHVEEMCNHDVDRSLIHVMSMGDFSSKSWVQFKNYVKSLTDSNHILDERLTFANTEVKKEDYRSKRLGYSLEESSCDAYEELISTLYLPEERAKLEWAIGAVVSGDARDIQKFIVLYGEHGTGKSTILNIIMKLFKGYYTTFEAKALASNNNAFSTEVFRSNPLVAIQHDGDLSRIEDNTKLNSIVSHEEMTMNEKFKASYTSKTNCFLFMATNKPVKITDAKSGIIRRLIDVKPSGKKLSYSRYEKLKAKIEFELGGIAWHCLQVYKEMGPDYYNSYVPLDMMFQTDPFFNFVEACYEDFKKEDGVTLSRAYDMYKKYCEEALVEYKLVRYKFREELKNYFREFLPVTRIDDKQVRSYYSGFIFEKFESSISKPERVPEASWIVLESQLSIFDEEMRNCPAQYANDKEAPSIKWVNVRTTLSDILSYELHYVKPPENHIVIDFDLKNSSGDKDILANIEAASKWPKTYCEVSKSGKGLHLHYNYLGDVKMLAPLYSPGIEIKTFTGGSSLRRKLSVCNGEPVSDISSGLPMKEEKMINFDAVISEKKLRELIINNLHKAYHPGTKPSCDFIYKLLDDAYSKGLKYDLRDIRPRVLAFAANSTNQSEYCVKLVSKMKFKSEDISEAPVSNEPIVFFDVEVFPNLFLINYKKQGDDKSCVRMVNPTPSEVESLFKYRLVGFNCRKYDNHILYARYLGYTNEELYRLSSRIISGSANCMFGEAYNISYTDVYDFSSKKQSLKKFEIELGIHHQELGLPWDQPVPEDKWSLVAEYCDNDVLATEAVFDDRQADWIARQILADIAGMTVNDTTNQLTTRIIFGKEKHPQSEFNYRCMGCTPYDPEKGDEQFTVFDDLGRPIFPGYTYENGKSMYRGEETGEGGYVYAEPGMYTNVALLDIASMHPSSIVAEQLFGPVFTERFEDILRARILIKHGDFEGARKLFSGRLNPYLEDETKAKALAQALKIAINSVYGLTSAKFDNPFRDIRNVDNIVAKRGALFMINLKHEVQKRGFVVAHIKTDSIKIPNATAEIIKFVMDYGRQYGYNFEHEATYNRMCLVNDAVYIAKYDDGTWTATGTQFQQPFVFKTLFSKEPIGFSDLCETKTVTSAIYLDMNEGLPEGEHNYTFVGKAGLFSPILPGCGGGLLMREKDGKYYAVTGTKGYRWLESERIENLGKDQDIDLSYYNALAKEAVNTISKYGDFDSFVNDDTLQIIPPWLNPCGGDTYEHCSECPKYKSGTCEEIYEDSSDYIFNRR